MRIANTPLLGRPEEKVTIAERSPVTEAIERFFEVAASFERRGEREELTFDIEDGPMQGQVDVAFRPNGYPRFLIELVPTDGRPYARISTDDQVRDGEVELLFSNDEVGDLDRVYMIREKDGKGWSCTHYQDTIEKPPHVSEALLMMHEVLEYIETAKPTSTKSQYTL